LRSQITNCEFREGEGSEYLYEHSKLGSFVEHLLELGIMGLWASWLEKCGFEWWGKNLVRTYGLLWKHDSSWG